jgi:hypothetical protein
MFLVKNNKSSFYQIVYFVSGKRTTHSTKKTTKPEAVQYLEEFSKGIHSDKKSLANPSGVITQKTCSKNTFTLSKFKEDYLEYAKLVKSKKYIDSISFSLKYLTEYTNGLLLMKLLGKVRLVRKIFSAL